MAERRFQILEISAEERSAFLDRIHPSQVLSEEDCRLIQGFVTGAIELVAMIERRDITLRRLRHALFGQRSEKTSAVFPPPSTQAKNPPPERPSEKPKSKGHGRQPAGRYTGARTVEVAHPQLHPGDACPECHDAKLYALVPALILRLVGQAPLAATRFELERLRCAGCGAVFTATAPPEAGTSKYDESVGVTVALLRYGSGLPMYRLERLQSSLGVPMPASVQWEQVKSLAQIVQPVWDHLIDLAAQRDLIHNDDTTMRVAGLRREPTGQEPGARPRTGIFTTGLLAAGPQPPIALFFTGHQHAGENLQDVLRRRDPHLPAPIQMCDALSRNIPAETPTLLAHCLAHGRRQVVDVAPSFPDQARRILETLGEVFHHDAAVREQRLDPTQRLLFHQECSQPILDDLHQWLRKQMDQKKVEPNSGLGGAIQYLLNHWEPLTLFLRVPGAPLDNNILERAIKMAVLHRKNSISYKTKKGAEVGDLFMSLIHTCRLNDQNPFDYLLALARHPRQVAERPHDWLPWTYRVTLASDTS
jgi:transposase